MVTRGLSDGHVIYALCIGPGSGYDGLARTFAQMLRTLDVSEDHGALAHSRVDSPR